MKHFKLNKDKNQLKFAQLEADSLRKQRADLLMRLAQTEVKTIILYAAIGVAFVAGLIVGVAL